MLEYGLTCAPHTRVKFRVSKRATVPEVLGALELSKIQ
jgi:hypothetical protein